MQETYTNDNETKVLLSLVRASFNKAHVYNTAPARVFLVANNA